MLAWLTMKNYVLIAIVTGVIIFFIAHFFGDTIANFMNDIRNQAVSAGVDYNLASIVVEPVLLLKTQPLIGALIIGAAWPLLLVWFLLIILLIILTFVVGGGNTVRDAVDV
ncbi:hypothetical protein MASR2M15_21500 [Anaerolineales bacterium]